VKQIKFAVLLHGLLILGACSSGGDDGSTSDNPSNDSIPPSISINLPTTDANFTTSSSSISIAGVSSDNIAVTGVFWETNDGQSGTATGTTNWQVDSVALTEGDNEIFVIAVDGAGNEGVDSIIVSVQSSGVVVNIQSPTSAGTFSTNNNAISMAGLAMSASGAITEVTWSNTQGDSGIASGTSTWTTPEINIAAGSTSFTITAQDDQGNIGTDRLQVIKGGTGFVEGKDTTPPNPAQAEPAFGDSYVDPAYGLTIRKMADATGTRFNRNIYSRIQPENSDSTLFLTYHGNAEYRIYDRQTLALVRSLPSLSAQNEIQWHPSNPRLVRFTEGGNSFDGTLRFMELNINDPIGTDGTVLVDLTGRLPWPDVDAAQGGGSGFIADGAEGSPSRDGNLYAWAVLNRFENLAGMVSVDISTDTILGTLDAADWAQFGDLDHVSMTPSGNAIVAAFDFASIAYDIDFSNPRILHEGTEHSDIAINAQGRDTFVIINFDTGDLMMVDIETAQRTNLFNIFQEDTDTSLHVSGKAFDKPGWVVVSSYFCRAQPGWACNKVIVVELAANPRILNLAHTYNCGQDFWTEPHAVPSRDLRRVYYNSDWGSCGIDAEMMMIDVPEF
jgi:hypothetical protein